LYLFFLQAEVAALPAKARERGASFGCDSITLVCATLCLRSMLLSVVGNGAPLHATSHLGSTCQRTGYTLLAAFWLPSAAHQRCPSLGSGLSPNLLCSLWEQA
jgi:hypothetical protein